MSFTKIFSLTATIFLSALSAAETDPKEISLSASTIKNMTDKEKEENLKKLDKKQVEKNKRFGQGHAKKKHELLSAYNSPAIIDVRSSWDVFISGSYIYWYAKEKGLELAVSNDNNGYLKVIEMDFDYKSGFKVGISTNFEHDGWNAFVEYTRLHQKESKKKNAPTGGFLTPIHTFYATSEEPPNNNNTSYSKETWYLDYDMIDVEIGRPCYVGTNLTFKPHIGTRLGWIGQKLRPRYIFTHLEEPASNIESGSQLRSTSWLLGSRAGIDSNWMIGKYFRIFGNAAAALCYQCFKTSFKQESYDENNHLNINVKNKFGYLVPNVDLSLGIGVGTYFNNYNWHFDLSMGYDFIYFWNQNEMRSLEDLVLRNALTKPADLMLHGLTITVRLDF